MNSRVMNRMVLGLSLALLAVGGRGDVAFLGSSGAYSASAVFALIDHQLSVRLTNTSRGDVLVPADVLTGVFFNMARNVQLNPVSAFVTSGSAVRFGSETGGNVGGEWAYSGSLTGGPNADRQGISAAGLGLFGPHDLFPGPQSSDGSGAGGIDFGLLSAGDDVTTGNAPVTGGNPLIQNSVTFRLSDLPGGFDLSDISDVWFQYGSSLSEGGFRANANSETPEPGALAFALTSGMVGLGAFWRSRRRPGRTGERAS